ncbi:hypothetical protein BJY04DRAFT_219344 [Aspergillus karnatakaensis]|uniref:uncharacterized protein n=1 Tax=Aspergillus karnatakaensis TaxID=1810916 RepID=UPI003CCD08A3
MSKISWFLYIVLIILLLVVHWYIPTRPIQPQHPATGMPNTKNTPAQPPAPRTPYNEDEIVAPIKEIYRTYIRLNYIKRWEIVWPPKTGHVINETLCAELNLDPAVISLMKRIPYFDDWYSAANVEFYTHSRAMVYLEDKEIRGGRDPDRFGGFDELRLDYLLPHEITLICSDDEGSNIILHIKETAIRVQDFYQWPPGKALPEDYDYKPERPDEEDHYRNFHAHHAPTWLSDFLKQIQALEILPINAGHRSLVAKDDKQAILVEKILREEFGWPDNFREAEWRAVGESVCRQLGEEDVDYDEIARTVQTIEEQEVQGEDAIVAYGKPVYEEEIDGPRE